MSDDLKKRLQSQILGQTEETEKGSSLIHHNEPMFSVTVGELKAAVDMNPNHPVASVYRKSIKGRKETDTLTVDRTDIQGLMDNRKIIPERKTSGGITYQRKVLVDFPPDENPKKNQKPEPSPPPEPEKPGKK